MPQNGLVVSESLRKGTPVVAGRAGGIPVQMPDEGSALLVDSVEESAEAILRLLREPAVGKRVGEAGQARVRERFLLPRLIADELRLYVSVLDRPGASRVPSLVGFEGEVRDPGCGMRLADEHALQAEWEGTTYRFCSEGCRTQFLEDPDRYVRTDKRT